MEQYVPAKIIATCFGLSAFAIAIISGLAADAEASTILWRAMWALTGCYVLGIIISRVGKVAIEEHVRAYTEATPIPEMSDHDAPIEVSEVSAQPDDVVETTL